MYALKKAMQNAINQTLHNRIGCCKIKKYCRQYKYLKIYIECVGHKEKLQRKEFTKSKGDKLWKI